MLRDVLGWPAKGMHRDQLCPASSNNSTTTKSHQPQPPRQTPRGVQGKAMAEEPVPLQQGLAGEMLGGGEPGTLPQGALNNTGAYKVPESGEAVTLPNPHPPREIAGAEEQWLPSYNIYIRIDVF